MWVILPKKLKKVLWFQENKNYIYKKWFYNKEDIYLIFINLGNVIFHNKHVFIVELTDEIIVNARNGEYFRNRRLVYAHCEYEQVSSFHITGSFVIWCPKNIVILATYQPIPYIFLHKTFTHMPDILSYMYFHLDIPPSLMARIYLLN